MVPPSDHRYFNCSEEYEIDYVAGLYEDEEEVKRFLKEKCARGEIKYMTHAELYTFLSRHGFRKKDEDYMRPRF